MEQNFQTSFIPKKPMIEERAVAKRSVGFLAIASIFILFTVLLTSVALYFYKGILTKKIVDMKASLDVAKTRFEPTKITELQVLDKRLRASNELLSKHVAMTPIFKVLQDVTMKTVRYTKFSYEIEDNNSDKVAIKLSGTADGYRSIALQSDLFTKNKNLIDPVFSNLSLDDKGNVSFDLDFAVDPTLVNYKLMLSKES